MKASETGERKKKERKENEDELNTFIAFALAVMAAI